ncbi:hypothetical protein Taro_043045, partial [Colocasia esculenta]|nr:hypothetical protein [Colocasia esculenta]
MLQALSQKMKKWSNGVDTRDLSQKACFVVLSCVSTRDEVVSTLETSPREASLPVWDSVSTLDQSNIGHLTNKRAEESLQEFSRTFLAARLFSSLFVHPLVPLPSNSIISKHKKGDLIQDGAVGSTS